MQKIYCVFLNSSKEFVKIVSSPTAKYGCVIKYVFVHIGTMMSKIFLQKDMAVLMTAHRTLDIGLGFHPIQSILESGIGMALLGIVTAAYHLRELGK